MSSRNQYLTPAERVRAAGIQRVLAWVKGELEGGRLDYAALEAEARNRLDREGFRVEYVALRRCADLLYPNQGDAPLVVLAAAWLGTTRLIDNLEACLAA
jgi:pantoate--beta-alanine ligase